MYLFLDESGECGIDFCKPGTSKYFIITLLNCKYEQTARQIRLAIKKTLHHKINIKKNKYPVNEKGMHTTIGTKQYFYKQLQNIINWELNTLVIDKRKFKMPSYIKYNIYDFFVGLIIDRICLTKKFDKLTLVVDRSKNLHKIKEFNRYIGGIIYPRLNDLVIYHKESHNEKVLQAVDLFCHGIFKKYEDNDLTWYNCFKNFITLEYLG